MIQLHDFSIGYGERTLLHEVEAAIPKGSLTALIGRNGTGKSTLLRAIAGLNRRYTGEILLDGRDISDMRADEMAKTLAFVTTERTRIANLKCEDVVAVGRAPYTNWIGRMQDADREIVAWSLASVGMSDYARRTMDKMSDGECQRIMIARALAQSTPVILLDDPTAFLDLPNATNSARCWLGWRTTRASASSFRPTNSTSPCRLPTASPSSTRRSWYACRPTRCGGAAASNDCSRINAYHSMLQQL